MAAAPVKLGRQLVGAVVGAVVGVVVALVMAVTAPVRLIARGVGGLVTRAPTRPASRSAWTSSRGARRSVAWQDAAAVLAGTPLPGESGPASPARTAAGRPRRGGRARSRAGMPLSETVVSAWEALTKHRLRSVLTMIGITIGVASVIALVAMGNGMRTNFDQQFSRLANQITVTSTSDGGPKFGQARDVTDQDVSALRNSRHAPDIAAVSPSVAKNATATVGQTQARTKILGVQYDYLDLMDRKIIAGRWLSQAQIADKARVVVLGADPVALLWPGVAPAQVIGSQVRVNNAYFTVAGVLKPDGQNDNVVITSFDGARSYLVGTQGDGRVDQIVVKATSVGAIEAASEEIAAVLDHTHHIRTVAQRDYNVLTYGNLLEKNARFIKTLTLFIVALAAISLLIGGVGVANIMLVSVTERTPEIGVRKAIGANKKAILRQFLSEAVLLTGFGGVIGVALGVGVTLTAARLLPPAGSPAAESTQASFTAPILTVQPVIAAFVISLGIGVLAGVYPAARAARMRPVNALRFE
jgi:putative ABC transport system permease protein